MVFKRSSLIIMALMMIALLAACVRSASTPPAQVATAPAEKAAEEVDVEEGADIQVTEQAAALPGGNDVLQQLELFVTQTAAAAQIAGGQAEQPAAQETPVAPAEEQETSTEAVPVQETTQAGSTEGQAGGQETPQATDVSTGGGQPAQATGVVSGGGQQPTQPVQPAQPTQSSTAPIVVPTATPGIPSQYTLQPGEFPYCIARRFNVNPLELLSINGLSTNSVVRGGTTLVIPKTGNPFPGERSLKAHPTTYIVAGGENIYEVACSFGDVSPDAIAYANGLKAPYTISSGQKLYIP